MMDDVEKGDDDEDEWITFRLTFGSPLDVSLYPSNKVNNLLPHVDITDHSVQTVVTASNGQKTHLATSC
jgi:hypothetical protein